jgi:hypothetical protein
MTPSARQDHGGAPRPVVSRWLCRWRPAGAVLVFLLGLAPGPLRRPGAKGPIPSRPSLAAPPEIACVQDLLPPDAVVLLFSSPDGGMQLDPSLHYLVQAQLAPRLLISRPPGDRAFREPSWFLGLAGGAEGARVLAEQHRLQVVGQCGQWSVLRRAP